MTNRTVAEMLIDQNGFESFAQKICNHFDFDFVSLTLSFYGDATLNKSIFFFFRLCPIEKLKKDKPEHTDQPYANGMV